MRLCLDPLHRGIACQSCVTRDMSKLRAERDKLKVALDRLVNGSHCWCDPLADDDDCGHCQACALLEREVEA